MNVLVVEDNVPQMESLGVILRDVGYTVYATPTLAGACKIAEVHRPAAVILDMMLVNGTGREMIRWLRTREETRDTLIVVATGLSPEQVADLEGQPHLVVLHKPYHVETLLEELAHGGVVPLHGVGGGHRG